jgi:hypothetical protein
MWPMVVFGLVAVLLGGCSSGMGSSMTGPSSQATNEPPPGGSGGAGAGTPNGSSHHM